ncbi:hypothetical protein CF319_g6606 [Tilletia indica]|nr:hypothetical protein CF319_g6606 [Tilletia indica]
MASLVPQLGNALGAVQAVLAQLSLKMATMDVVEKEAESTRKTIETAFGNLASLLNGRMEVESARERARRALAFGAQQLANASAELASTSMSTSTSSPDDNEATPVDTSFLLPPSSSTTSTSTASALPSTPLLTPPTPLSAPVTLRSAPIPPQPQQQSSQSDLSITDLALRIKTVGQLMCEWKQGESGVRQPLQQRVNEGDESLMKGSGSARKQLSRWRMVVALVEELSAGRDETVVITAMDRQMVKEKVSLRALAEKRGEQRIKWIETLDVGTTTTTTPSPL